MPGFEAQEIESELTAGPGEPATWKAINWEVRCRVKVGKGG